MSEHSLLHRQIAQIYRKLGEQHMQMQELSRAIDQLVNPRGEQRTENPSHYKQVPASSTSSTLQNIPDPEFDCSTADVFFDCISRFSEDDSDSSIERLHARFSGSPDYCLESQPSFFPEQYTADYLITDRVFVVAMKSSREDYRMQQYYLMYPRTPRRWRRVVVLAYCSEIREDSSISAVLAPDNLELGSKTSPKHSKAYYIRYCSQLSFSVRLQESL